MHYQQAPLDTVAGWQLKLLQGQAATGLRCMLKLSCFTPRCSYNLVHTTCTQQVHTSCSARCPLSRNPGFATTLIPSRLHPSPCTLTKPGLPLALLPSPCLLADPIISISHEVCQCSTCGILLTDTSATDRAATPPPATAPAPALTSATMDTQVSATAIITTCLAPGPLPLLIGCIHPLKPSCLIGRMPQHSLRMPHGCTCPTLKPRTMPGPTSCCKHRHMRQRQCPTHSNLGR